MKRKKIIVFVLISIFTLTLSLCLQAETAEDLSERIVIDGYSQDFSADEALFIKEPLDSCQELNDDSWWGEYNDVRQLKVTWDEEYLYLAVDACCWDNNVIFFLDVYDDYGIQDMLELNTWMRAFKFYGSNPDFFMGTWDTNDNPQFWKLDEGSNQQAQQVTIVDSSTYNTGELDRSMEAAIPWSKIYYNSERNMADYPILKMVAVVTTGSDNLSGPDVIPNNLGGMPDDAQSTALLDNYLLLNVDADSSGTPDFGVKPREIVDFYKTPPFKEIALEINKVKFPDGKILYQSGSEPIPFNILLNDTTRIISFDAEIYNLEGRHLADATKVGDAHAMSWTWDGRDKHGKKVPFGIYLLRFIADSGEISKNEAITVIK